MAIQVNKSASASFALVASYNALRGSVAVDAGNFHADVTSSVTTGDYTNPAAAAATCTTANASSLPTSIALANALKAAFNVHIADAVAHSHADAANPIATVDASDLGTTVTLANAIKTKFNLHLAQATVHFTDDTNSVSTTNASDQGTANTLLNALKAAFNIHMQNAPAGSSITLVGP